MCYLISLYVLVQSSSVRITFYSATTFFSKADKVFLADSASLALANLTASATAAFYYSKEWREVLTSFYYLSTYSTAKWSLLVASIYLLADKNLSASSRAEIILLPAYSFLTNSLT